MRVRARAAPVLAAALALGCQRELPPLGEALVIVDTDLRVPQMVNHLRVDLYGVDRATWLVSRDVPTPDPSIWPVSFSVFDPDTTGAAPRQVVLRLRAYLGGIVRDYRGERFTPRAMGGGIADPAPIAPIPDGEAPRLMDAMGNDITPETEPQPYVAVDQLVQLDLSLGNRGSVRVVLRGACAGTMADLVGGATCVDTENLYAPIQEAALDPDLSLPTTSQQGSFGAETPCTAAPRPATTLPDGTPLFDEEVCVPGRMFVFGSSLAYGRGDSSDVPQRAAIVPPFLMDRYEVTLARWRDALARGFEPNGSPLLNDGTLDFTSPFVTHACTWTSVPMGREALPLNCVSSALARAFCQFEGGDLPTEAQREYVAMDAGRDTKTPYPWGEDLPTCARAVYARQPPPGLTSHGADCSSAGKGLAAADAVAGPGGDVAVGTGLVDLAGSLSEILRDTYASLGSACWASQGLTSPTCVDPSSANVSLRSGSWADNAGSLPGDFRGEVLGPEASPTAGFRCVRPVQ